MTKIFTLICAGIICFSCNDKQTDPQAQCPVKEVEMPASDAASPIEPGSSVTIQGKGFSEDCQIWLHSATRTEVQAQITNISAADLTFTAPTVSGEQAVVLKQDGGSFKLGSLFFDTPSDDNPVEILPNRVSYLRIMYPDDMTFSCRFAYDTQGRIVSTTETDFQYTQPNIPIPADRITTYAYTQNRITSQDNTDPAQVITETFDLENGRTVKYTRVNNLSRSYADYYTFSYDSKGYLSRSKWTTNEDDSSESGSYSVIGGSLERMQKQDGIEQSTYATTAHFTNAPAQRNNLNIDLFGLADLTIGELPAPEAFLLQVSGTRFSTLPANCTLTTTEKDQTGTMVESGKEIYTYQYQMKGAYISRIQIYGQEGPSANKELSAQIEFFYEE